MTYSEDRGKRLLHKMQRKVGGRDLPSSALCWSAGVFFYLALRSRSLSEEAQEDLRTKGDGDASPLVVRLSLMGPGGQ